MTESLQQSASQLDCSEYEREAASPERFDKRAQRSEVELHFLGEGNRQELYIHTYFFTSSAAEASSASVPSS